MSREYMENRVDQHDIQCGKMAGELFKNKFFAEESVTYGTAYWMMGKRWFFVSNEYIKVHQFASKQLLKDIYCTPINCFHQKEHVLEGESEYINRRNKLDLCKMMKQAYSSKSFMLLQSFAEKRNLDVAQEILMKIRKNLEGTVDVYALKVFLSINRYAFDMKKITLLNYINNQAWAEQRSQALVHENPLTENYFRSFSGIVYIDKDNNIKYYDNALLELTVKKRNELIKEKKMVSHVFERTYSFDNMTDLHQVNREFSEELRNRYDASYLKILQSIHDLPSPIDFCEFHNKKNARENDFTCEENEMLDYYEGKWGIEYKESIIV